MRLDERTVLRCPRRRIGLALGILGWGLALLFAGCSKPPQTSAPSRGTALTEDTLLNLSDALRKEADLNAYRNSVQQLNGHLGRKPTEKPAPLTEAERQLLTSQFALTPDELAEVESGTFTLLDAHHFDLCFLLDEVARSLALDNEPPLRRASAAFDWVIRQVRLREGSNSLLPPQFALRWGWGNPLERATIFLALLDQLEIPGCLVAVPSETEKDAPQIWLVGALIDREIYLFDPRMGMALPSADGPGIATLAQIRAQSDPFQSLRLDETHRYDGDTEKAKRSQVYLASSLTSLAPRMRYLQSVLPANDKIILGIDPVAVQKRFQEALQGPAFTGCTVHVWNQPGIPNTPVRALRSFLTAEDGGVDRAGRQMQFMVELTPWNALPQIIRELPGEPGQKLQQLYHVPFVAFTMEPRMPRELVLRGRFPEASKMLVGQLDGYRDQRARLRAQTTLQTDVSNWCSQAIDAYGELLRLEGQSTTPGGRSSASPAALAAARNRVNQLWKESGKVVILVQGLSAGPLAAETTYLLALCKQEQAERAQARLDAATRAGKSMSASDAKRARDAWKPAADWWQTYLEEYPAGAGAASARLLRARALEALGDRNAAVALLRDLSGSLTELEQTVRLYKARRLESGSGSGGK